ncbi:MAG: tetratricopeptide repeat protein, partial [Pseudomonadales bacterium]|nr:tetratricopeptide repeat protein [Pseudomonadales bacterium]
MSRTRSPNCTLTASTSKSGSRPIDRERSDLGSATTTNSRDQHAQRASSRGTLRAPPLKSSAGRKRSGASLEAEVQKAQDLLRAGQAKQAREFLEPLVSRHPNQTELQYCYAVTQRLLGQLSDALASIQSVLKQTPRYGRAFQELAYIYLAHGETEHANHAFRQAVEHNPGLF